MYPSRFEYLAPTSVEEVIAALGEREGAKVMAGGQSLIPVLKLRVAAVDTVVDVNRVVGLDTLNSIAQVMFREFAERRFAAPPTLRKMVAAGWYGTKSGKGFYDYSGEKPVPSELGL